MEIIDARVTQVHINDIRLGWMMVPRQNSQDVLRLIPVWDFYGYNIVKNTHTEETEKRNILATTQLTVNALDGSSINRITGY